MNRGGSRGAMLRRGAIGDPGVHCPVDEQFSTTRFNHRPENAETPRGTRRELFTVLRFS